MDILVEHAGPDGHESACPAQVFGLPRACDFGGYVMEDKIELPEATEQLLDRRPEHLPWLVQKLPIKCRKVAPGADLGQHWPTCGQLRPKLSDLGETWAEFGQDGPLSASFGRILPMLAKLPPVCQETATFQSVCITFVRGNAGKYEIWRPRLPQVKHGEVRLVPPSRRDRCSSKSKARDPITQSLNRNRRSWATATDSASSIMSCSFPIHADMVVGQLVFRSSRVGMVAPLGGCHEMATAAERWALSALWGGGRAGRARGMGAGVLRVLGALPDRHLALEAAYTSIRRPLTPWRRFVRQEASSR